MRDRPSELEAILVLHIRWICGREIGPGVQYLVAQVFVGFAVILVGPTLGAEVDDTSRVLAPFRADVVVLDFKFTDRVLNRNDDRQIDVADVQGLSVQVLRALVGEGTAYLIVSPAEWVLADWSAARTALGDSGRGQKNQVKYVATVQRNIVRLALVYDLTERRGVRRQKWRFGRHFDRLRLCADFQRNVNARANLHLDGNVRALDVLETGLVHLDRVRPRVQVDERILSIPAGGKCRLEVRGRTGQRDRGVGNCSARGIRDCTAN